MFGYKTKNSWRLVKTFSKTETLVLFKKGIRNFKDIVAPVKTVSKAGGIVYTL